MRLPLAILLCLAAAPVLAGQAEDDAARLGITAPLGSQERSDQITRAAQDFAANFAAKMNAGTAERQDAVLSRVSEACANMYRRNPDATVINAVCLDVFLADGLPD